MENQLTYKKLNHIPWVDVYKGICIIMVVMGHAGAPFTTYIYLFHMSAFILISGFTYSGENYSFFNYLKKKVLLLLLPMICINIFYIIVYTILQRFDLYKYFQNGEPISFLNRIKLLFQWVGTPDFGGATWFLIVLFTIEILFKIFSDVCSIIRIKNLDIIVSILFSLIGWICISKGYILNYYFDLSSFGMLFFGIGVLLGRNKNIDEYIDKKVMTIFSLFIVVFFGSFYFKGQLPMNWPTRQFPSLPILILSSLCAIYLCYIISKVIETSNIFYKVFSYIGKRTYSILVFHFMAFRIIFGMLVIVKEFPIGYLKELTPRYSSGIQWLAITIVSIGICIFVSFLAQMNIIPNFIFNAKLKINKEGN
ncbi:acyltransferase family protein [Anaeromicropila herbilytica]|uniref:O-acetyltransferase n=1 Tax=Anaeromicropila herbilytica TaxID=2785025 RepID=A0A7R7ENI8_9FIRM|nr:acyltransferase family protein [Anaeromicropila herbilytica]BCN32215.1 O-acetyltransferase [Anaeromicropila herbilytica]